MSISPKENEVSGKKIKIVKKNEETTSKSSSKKYPIGKKVSFNILDKQGWARERPKVEFFCSWIFTFYSLLIVGQLWSQLSAD